MNKHLCIYLVYTQIWLNIHLDDCHFAYIKKQFLAKTPSYRYPSSIHAGYRHSEPEPTSAPRRMNHGKWSGNSFLLAFSSQANHGG